MDNFYICKRYKLRTTESLKLLMGPVIYIFKYFFHTQSRIKSLNTVTHELIWCGSHFDIYQRWPSVICVWSQRSWVADYNSYLYKFHIHTSPILSTAVSLETHFPHGTMVMVDMWPWQQSTVPLLPLSIIGNLCCFPGFICVLSELLIQLNELFLIN